MRYMGKITDPKDLTTKEYVDAALPVYEGQQGEVLGFIQDNVVGAMDLQLDRKADKVTSATNGDFAGLDANGNLTDSGKKAADFATAAQGAKADSAVQTVVAGDNNGTIKVDGTNVSVTGLKSAAYTESSAYATAAQGTKADTAYQKPNTGIPSTDMTTEVQASLGKADSAYQKPNTGIPSTDMTTAVQTSLGKADSALQTHQTVTLASGTNSGTLKITTAAGTTDNVAVTGLGSAAYTESTAYATAAQGAKADTALQSHQTVTLESGTNNGTLKITTAAGTTDNVAVKGIDSAAYKADTYFEVADATILKQANIVDNLTSTSTTQPLSANQGKVLNDKIVALPSAMVFKGTVGEGGTVSDLPTASASTKGHVYKVITDGTYAGQAAKVGDMFICNDTPAWVHIPSGDEPSGTVTNVATGTGLTGGPITTTGTIALDSASIASLAKADSALQSHQEVTLASGTNNGTLKITTAAGTSDNIAVTGLGSAAYTASTAYATAAQGTTADTAASDITTIKGTGWTNETIKGNADAITVLNGNESTAGSVAKTVKDAINTLDVSDITGFGTDKTLATLSETDGKIAATFQDIQTMSGATASAAGAKGFVPAPATGDESKYLKGDGTWATVDALPSQSGQSGKYLTTDGSAASWATLDLSTKADIAAPELTTKVESEVTLYPRAVTIGGTATPDTTDNSENIATTKWVQNLLNKVVGYDVDPSSGTLSVSPLDTIANNQLTLVSNAATIEHVAGDEYAFNIVV